MTLHELTALMSRVGRRKPELMRDRSVTLFIQECIDEAKFEMKTPAASEEGDERV